MMESLISNIISIVLNWILVSLHYSFMNWSTHVFLIYSRYFQYLEAILFLSFSCSLSLFFLFSGEATLHSSLHFFLSLFLFTVILFSHRFRRPATVISAGQPLLAVSFCPPSGSLPTLYPSFTSLLPLISLPDLKLYWDNCLLKFIFYFSSSFRI